MGFLKGRKQKKGVGHKVDDTDGSYSHEFDDVGYENTSNSTLSGHTAETEETRRTKRSSLTATSNRITEAFKHNVLNDSTSSDELSCFDYKDDESKCDTYLEGDDGKKETLSPFEALQKSQRLHKNNKKAKKNKISSVNTSVKGQRLHDIHDLRESSSESSYETDTSADDEYESFFEYLDKQQQTRKSSQNKSKKEKKKKKKSKGNSSKSKKKNDNKKIKNGKKKSEKKNSGKLIISSAATSSPASPETFEGTPSGEKKIMKKDILNRKIKKEFSNFVSESTLQQTQSPESQHTETQFEVDQNLDTGSKHGDARVAGAARRALRRSSMGTPMPSLEAQMQEIQEEKDHFAARRAARRSNPYRRSSVGSIPSHPSTTTAWDQMTCSFAGRNPTRRSSTTGLDDSDGALGHSQSYHTGSAIPRRSYSNRTGSSPALNTLSYHGGLSSHRKSQRQLSSRELTDRRSSHSSSRGSGSSLLNMDRSDHSGNYIPFSRRRNLGFDASEHSSYSSSPGKNNIWDTSEGTSLDHRLSAQVQDCLIEITESTKRRTSSKSEKSGSTLLSKGKKKSSSRLRDDEKTRKESTNI